MGDSTFMTVFHYSSYVFWVISLFAVIYYNYAQLRDNLTSSKEVKGHIYSHYELTLILLIAQLILPIHMLFSYGVNLMSLTDSMMWFNLYLSLFGLYNINMSRHLYLEVQR